MIAPLPPPFSGGEAREFAGWRWKAILIFETDGRIFSRKVEISHVRRKRGGNEKEGEVIRRNLK
jgi:hypothetical protein